MKLAPAPNVQGIIAPLLRKEHARTANVLS